MKHLKIAGLCLVAMFAMSMAAAATASAVAWQGCRTGGTATKYTTSQCTTASSSGTFSWQEVTGTEKTKTLGTLTLSDTKVPIEGTVSVGCTGEGVGSVGPGKFDRVEKIENISCSAGEHCEKLEENAKPLHLPWQTELVEESGKVRDLIRSGGAGEPGWAVKCKVLGVVKTDECTSEEGSTAAENRVTNSELLVLLSFEEKSANAKCSVGGAGSGRVRGSLGLLLAGTSPPAIRFA